MVLYAKWEPTTSTVLFNANGGTVSVSTKSVKYDGLYSYLPEPTRSGYAFIGWFTAASGGNGVTAQSKLSQSQITLYAQWLPLAETFVANMANGMRKDPNLYLVFSSITPLGKVYPEEYYKGNEMVTVITDDSDGEYIEYFGPNSLDFARLKELGYTQVIITLTMNIQEYNDGYQEVYVYDRGSETKLWEKTDIDHDPTKCEPIMYAHTFSFTVSIDALTGQGLKMVYGANGKDDDTWQLGETTISFEVIK